MTCPECKPQVIPERSPAGIDATGLIGSNGSPSPKGTRWFKHKYTLGDQVLIKSCGQVGTIVNMMAPACTEFNTYTILLDEFKAIKVLAKDADVLIHKLREDA